MDVSLPLPPHMNQKKLFYILLIVILIIGGYLLTAFSFPKNTGRYPLFVLILLIDFYVWGMFKKKVFTYSRFNKSVTVVFYWLPLILLIGTSFSLIFLQLNTWNPWVRNLIFGSIFSFYLAKIIMAMILGIADLLKIIRQTYQLIVSRSEKPKDEVSKKITRAKFLENVALVTGGLVVSSMFVGMFKWVHDFNIKEVFVSIKNLPDIFEDYKIVQISDLHLGTWSNEGPLMDAINLINDLNPDLVVFTGDLVNYSTDEAFRFKEILAELKAKDGVYAILGNHDYGDYIKWPSKAEKQQNMESLYQFYNSINWKLLRNENVVIERGEDKLALIGVENWGANKRFPQLGNIVKASKGIGKVPVKILLSHDPSHWDAVVLKEHQDIDLMLAGHTHGFQFGIEIPGIKWSPAQYIYQQWAGLYENNETKQQLYVNRGLGSIGYPGRIGILPEITLINLQS